MKSLFFLILFFFGMFAYAQEVYTVKSPDSKVVVNVSTEGGRLTYSVRYDGKEVIQPSAIAMELGSGTVLGTGVKVKSAVEKRVNEVIRPPFYRKSEIQDVYNRLNLDFKGNYGVEFRVYNDGAAYRFFTAMKEEITIVNEKADFVLAGDYTAYIPYARARQKEGGIEKYFFNSFENTYTVCPVSGMDVDRLAFLPVLFEIGDGKKMLITEADLEDYPGMYLRHTPGKDELFGVFAPYPKKEVQGGHNNLQMVVTERENYIARTQGTRIFPWRVMAFARRDIQLADNDMVYRLAAPARIADASWIKPGKVAWDWWNDWNVSGVDFKAGINNDTYKYYIDFASKYGIEYVILDEGWAVNKKADLFAVIPEIDLEELIAYGKERNVGIVLWAGYHAIDRDMEQVCKHYADMGVKGFKVDFMDRDDQKVVDFYYRLAEVAARHHLMIDYHGAYKPTGLQRTYPNVINFEGVFGLEQMKWSAPSVDQVTYDVTAPFIRMVAGPMDYTQGAMRNATKGNYFPVNTEPMSQGTRCRQLAEYVIFESPFNMLCDNPTNYMKEPECTAYIAEVPTTWEETIGLDGKVGEYIAIARRQGGVWYVAGMTNWTPRELTVNLDFLGAGDYKAEIFRDGANADRVASDYKREAVPVPENREMKLNMAPGGGFVLKITRE